MYTTQLAGLRFTHLVQVTTGSSYAATPRDTIIEINKGTGSATAVTLPWGPSKGDCCFVKDGKGDAATNNITISAASGDIDGVSTLVIATDYGSAFLYYNGSEWKAMTGSASGSAGLGGIVNVPLLAARNNDGTGLAAAASSGKFGISDTPATALYLVSEAAQNNTKTDICQFDVMIPDSYNAGQDITLTINALHVESSGTVLTNTILPKAFITANDGTQGADVIGTTATAITGTAADYTFTIPGSGITPGARLLLQITSVAIEGGNTGTTKNEINSVRLS